MKIFLLFITIFGASPCLAQVQQKIQYWYANKQYNSGDVVVGGSNEGNRCGTGFRQATNEEAKANNLNSLFPVRVYGGMICTKE